MSPFSDFDDWLFIAEELEDPREISPSTMTWFILIVDDDHCVHEATKMCLSNMVIHGLKISCISAYSGEEACTILEKTEGIDLVLLDYGMETSEAGLKVVRYLSNDFGRPSPIIVMRTGCIDPSVKESLKSHPGISAFLHKTEATRMVLWEVLNQWLPAANV